MQPKSYTASDQMKSLIADNPLLLMAMSRFGISLGFGEKRVGEICDEHGVDTSTFLAVSNYISKGIADYAEVKVESLMRYLKNAHTYYLDYCLPTIRRRLLEAIDCSGSDEVAMMILKFYDEYTAEVSKHMQYEDETVFRYVDSLLSGSCDSKYTISVFASGHHSIDSKLSDLKEIIIRYLPQRQNNQLNAVLFDIINCREDLIAHCAVEDKLFVPAVEALEQDIAKNQCSCGMATADGLAGASGASDSSAVLSERERDIIACVARGMSNKEIADALCISVHTVTTHRRNIASKLQVHSSAGLAIYAVINGIISLETT